MIELRRCLSDLQVCFFRIARANKEKSYESYQAELALYVSVYLSDLFTYVYDRGNCRVSNRFIYYFSNFSNCLK